MAHIIKHGDFLVKIHRTIMPQFLPLYYHGRKVGTFRNMYKTHLKLTQSFPLRDTVSDLIKVIRDVSIYFNDTIKIFFSYYDIRSDYSDNMFFVHGVHYDMGQVREPDEENIFIPFMFSELRSIQQNAGILIDISPVSENLTANDDKESEFVLSCGFDNSLSDGEREQEIIDIPRYRLHPNPSKKMRVKLIGNNNLTEIDLSETVILDPSYCYPNRGRYVYLDEPDRQITFENKIDAFRNRIVLFKPPKVFMKDGKAALTIYMDIDSMMLPDKKAFLEGIAYYKKQNTNSKFLYRFDDIFGPLYRSHNNYTKLSLYSQTIINQYATGALCARIGNARYRIFRYISYDEYVEHMRDVFEALYHETGDESYEDLEKLYRLYQKSDDLKALFNVKQEA